MTNYRQNELRAVSAHSAVTWGSSSGNISEKIAIWQPFGLDECDVNWLRDRFGPRITLPVAVVVRCLDGQPSVVKMPLIRDGNPFPTLFWLTDPALTPKITALEYGGGVARAEQYLRDNDDVRAIFLDQHVRYRNARWESATLHEQRLAIVRGYNKKLSEVGIGGIADFLAVKCLHLHVAHFLATQDNVIGKWALDQMALEYLGNRPAE
jgi:hypothetical protein